MRHRISTQLLIKLCSTYMMKSVIIFRKCFSRYTIILGTAGGVLFLRARSFYEICNLEDGVPPLRCGSLAPCDLPDCHPACCIYYSYSFMRALSFSHFLIHQLIRARSLLFIIIIISLHCYYHITIFISAVVGRYKLYYYTRTYLQLLCK